MQAGNLLSFIPYILPDELFEEIVSTKNVRIERIISKGHASPEGFWYDQEENEWVMLVKGEAALQIEGQEERIILQEGMYFTIPAHLKHRVEWTKEGTETIWLAVFY
ncbi:cupin domain-containing protein [Tellurirhabdus bombi]|uniref:cupin domain-containing protein n=1 Tax=Tellurirhabdus bombi TaxID=2907205 RepID=UPI001F3D6748|nr:cupin domain-containing protein [Tellurirhabdus bombi]